MRSKAHASPRTGTVPAAGKLMGADFLADFGREQVAMMMDASAALCRGFEAMRAIQQKAAQEASSRRDSAAARLRENCTANDLITVPFGIWQEELQSAARYWQDLAAAALETQTEIMDCAGHLVSTDAVLETVSAAEALDAIPGVRQLFPQLRNGGVQS